MASPSPHNASVEQTTVKTACTCGDSIPRRESTTPGIQSYVIGGIGVFGQVVPSGALIASPAQCNRPSRRAGQSSFGPDHDHTGYQANWFPARPVERRASPPLVGPRRHSAEIRWEEGISKQVVDL
ncbi:hypothetical protein Bbelb_113940 [Branchiostoma belcheri]|nr:hypothetical protein Bbelb_113940 [Branchiostoma belcheri]